MSSLFFPQVHSPPRFHLNYWSYYTYLNIVQLREVRSGCKWGPVAMARKKTSTDSVVEEPNENGSVVKKKTAGSSKRSSTRTRKKTAVESPEENTDILVDRDASIEESTSTSSEVSKKTTRRTRRKGASNSANVEEEKKEKKVRRLRKPKEGSEIIEDKVSEAEIGDQDDSPFVGNVEESEDDLEVVKDEEEDVSLSYGWPPLVCCFGAAQHAFVPSGRPANRVIDYEIHGRMKDALWSPEKFIRAPGGSAGSVAIALASLGGKVAFMGKLGDDDYGQAMLYYMNVNNVQTRSLHVDNERPTAVSLMKISKRGQLRMSCVKPSAEDCLSKSEINIDVLKEAKMFYFNTHSLLDPSMRSTALRAIKLLKKLGGVIFYDLNLPMPLWHSLEETKLLIQEVWNMADIVEVTKQELEFLCGITPSEEFDTKNNARSKFVHYEPEVVLPLWHETLKVLFVTNGTSKIHYYTDELNGAVSGMEDPPLTPFTCDMSASGDGIVAALLRMLTVQPHLITDKGYLEHSIKYAIDCGVIDQWVLGRTRGFPANEDSEEVTPDENGIRSITEKEYRTIVSEEEVTPGEREYRPLKPVDSGDTLVKTSS